MCFSDRRKQTGSERLIWAQGSPSTLKAVTTTLNGIPVTLAAAICWENFMPLLRQSLYSQNVNLYLAPTADGRETWLPLMRTIGCEGRTFVLSANQCVRYDELPEWIRATTTTAGDEGEGASLAGIQEPLPTPTPSGTAMGTTPLPSRSILDSSGTSTPGSQIDIDGKPGTAGRKKISPFVSRGGSCIISPFGEVLAGPIWEVSTDDNPDRFTTTDELESSVAIGDGLAVSEIDVDDCVRGKMDFGVAGGYLRGDSFHLAVDGLCLDPPV